MRWVLLGLLLLAACTVQPVVDQDPAVRAFLGFFPDASYAERVADALPAECGSVPGRPRLASYSAEAAVLDAYVYEGAVVCAVPRLNEEAFRAEVRPASEAPAGVVALVNNEPVMAASLAFGNGSRDQALVWLVEAELLRQASRGVPLDRGAVDDAVAALAAALGYADVASFAEALAAEGGSVLAVQEAVAARLRVARYLADEGLLEAGENPFLFRVPVARFQQVFIRDGRDAESRRGAALLALRDGEDFCDVVAAFSDDVEGRARCGEYVITPGSVLPEIEAAVFALAPGGLTVIRSENGYHVLRVVGHGSADAAGAGVPEERFRMLLLRLRADADVVLYTG